MKYKTKFWKIGPCIFKSKCSILNGQVAYVEKSNLNIANIWLISLDCVTYFVSKFPMISCDVMCYIQNHPESQNYVM